MLRQFITCPLCGRGYGSASIDIHIPQCYDKALKRWKIEPIGPRPVMPKLNKTKCRTIKGAFSGDTRFANEQPCGISKNTPQSLFTNFERDAFSVENPNLHACSKCGRKFIFDRIGYHERVCKGNLKRRVFESSRQRRSEDESFGSGVHNISSGRKGKKKNTDANQSIGFSVSQQLSTWRHQHEEFIEAIRGARRNDQSRQRQGAVKFDQDVLQVSHSAATASSRRAGVPASMIRQSTTFKSNIAHGGRAGHKVSASDFLSTSTPWAPIHNRNNQRQFQNVTTRGDSHKFTVCGGAGSGGIRIAKDNTTSLGMLQAFGRA
ncbi:unnamed protein product [Phytomonas sp. Hart1]|nr:unnamed protein product [Phytomonas sp. Hart1]|eukprot:CCW67091.1 unnamed protein product [Phytomonas sp. isolate Hart1]